MQRNNLISQELETIAPGLLSGSTHMPYSLPEDYFTQLPEQVLIRAQAQSNPAGTVPEGYFENFAASMMQKVQAIEQPQGITESGELLNSISKQMPYRVPQGYFENFTVALPQESTPVASVIPMAGGHARSIWQWAAAAILVCTIGITYWYTTQPENIAAPTANIQVLEQELAATDEAIITAYLDNEADEAADFVYFLMQSEGSLEENIQQISTETIEQYLQNTPAQVAL